MDNAFLTAEKGVLAAIVKIAQKQRLEGDQGDWKMFLRVHDKKTGGTVSDPAKRSADDLLAFIKTLSDEHALKSLAQTARSLSDRISQAQLTDSPDSPQQRLVRLTVKHPDYLLNYSFQQDEEWVSTEIGKLSKAVNFNSMVAVDCEMVLLEDGTEAVVQVCVVDQNMEVKLDELVKPNKPVANYRTEITGLSAKDLEGVDCSLADVQRKLKKLLRKGTILVGHSLHNDLKALKLNHARVIDTSYIFEASSYHRIPSLNDLCKTVLGSEVRKEGVPHNCLNDAQAAMKLVLAKVDSGIDDRAAQTGEDKSQAAEFGRELLVHGIPRSVPREELHRIFPDFTFDLQLRPIHGKPKKAYSVIAVFKSPEEAHKAFESLKSEVNKDHFGYSQKPVTFELSTGLPTPSFRVRKMVENHNFRPTPSEKPIVVQQKRDNSCDQNTASKKRSAKVEDAEPQKKQKINNITECEHHIIEIERLKRELQARDDELSSLQRIVTALTRKQGL